MRRSPIARLLTLFVALLQLGAPALASVADARLERDSQRSPRAAAHVESHGSPQCARVHPADCGLCQVVGAVAVAPRPATPPAAKVAGRAIGAEARLGARADARYALALPRAPPAA